ncbi:MAG: ABC transporter ATP-binding protein [Algicola sp.]|nr:ABC transporter ATP-binding protein [Algicola sp.]
MKQIGELYRFLARYVGESRRVVGSICTLSVVDQGFSIGCVYVWKDIIDKYLIRAKEWTVDEFFIGVLSLIFLWQAMSFVSRLAKNRQYYQTRVLADKISMEFMERAFSHVVALSLDFHETRRTGQVMRQLSKAREDLNNIIQAFFDKLVMQAISFFIVTAFFFYIQWQIALLMLIFIPLFLLITRRYSKNIDTIQQSINDDNEHSYDSVQQALDAFMVVQSFQTQKVESARLQHNNRLHYWRKCFSGHEFGSDGRQ